MHQPILILFAAYWKRHHKYSKYENTDLKYKSLHLMRWQINNTGFVNYIHKLVTLIWPWA